jgi:hypothetical protein
MKIEFTAVIPSKDNQDLLDNYAIFSLLGSAIAEVSDRDEQEKLEALKPDKKYRVTIEEI